MEWVVCGGGGGGGVWCGWCVVVVVVVVCVCSSESFRGWSRTYGYVYIRCDFAGVAIVELLLTTFQYFCVYISVYTRQYVFVKQQLT